MKPYPGKLSILGILLLINVTLQVINPQIIRYYIDEVTSSTKIENLTYAALLFIGIAIIQQIINVFVVYLSQDLAWSSTNLLRSDLFEHCLDLDMTFHNKYKPGEMIERIDGDMTNLANFFSVFILMLLSNLLLILGILFALYLEGLVIGIAFTIFTLVALISMYFVRNIAVPYWKEVREAATNIFGFVEERLGGTEDIRANGGIPSVMQKFHKLSKFEYDKTQRAIRVSWIVGATISMIVAIGLTLVFVTTIPLYNQNRMSLASIFLITYYVTLLFGPIFQLLRQLQDLQQADASIIRIEEIFDTEKKIIDIGEESIPDDIFDVQFNELSFSYIENEKVLSNLSFHLSQGKSLGLIGKTGSGKTTLSRMIFRLYDPVEGSVKINGIDIRDLKLADLRSSIAIVTQTVELFNASLRENITFFDPTIPDELICNVINEVGLQKWYDQLPEGLDTVIQSEGVGLSAGEAQLLAFTRVFLKNPKLVILDEASSRLDPATEKLIEQAINKLIENRTAIIIAHRLSTLDRVDEVLILEKGEKIEFGNRLERLRDPESHFSYLIQTGIEELLS